MTLKCDACGAIARSEAADRAYLSPDLSDISSTARSYLDKEVPRPPFLIEGLIHGATKTGDPGSVVLLVGKPSSGKTWIATEMAKAVGGGTPFYGLETTKGRVGMILLESTAWQLQDRLKTLGAGDWLDNVSIISISELKASTLDLLTPDVQSEVAAWCFDKRLLILDPLAFMHTLGDLNSEERAVPLMEALKSIARLAGVAVVAIHHSRKRSNDAREQDDTLDMVRGSGALTAAAGVVLGVRESLGRIRLEVGKSQASAIPIEGLWLNWSDPKRRAGPVVLADAPEDQSEGRSHRVEAVYSALVAQGPSSKKDIHDAIRALGHKVEIDATKSYLSKLVQDKRVRMIGGGPSTRYEVIGDGANASPMHPRFSLTNNGGASYEAETANP